MFSSFLRISIHLMLRFNFTSLYKSKVFLGISIHLMLRFNYGFCRRCNWSLWISIHLMLRFNSVSFVRVAEAGKFQYILCCGSTSCFKNKSGLLILFQYILCCGSTFDLERGEKGSTHFNTSYVAVQLNKMVVII